MAKTPEVHTVQMDDGRTVEFTGKKRLDKTIEIKDGVVSVRLDFVNGETRTFTVPPELLLQCAGHGASQKLGDEISNVTDIEDAIETIDQLMSRLSKGQWLADREGGTGMAGASILAKALVEYSSQPIAVVREYLSPMTNKEKAALRATPEVAVIVQRLEAEKAARAAERGKAVVATVDTTALLAKLGAAPAANTALPSA